MATIALNYLYATVLFTLHFSFLVISISLQYFKKTWRKIQQNVNTTGNELFQIQYLTKKLDKIPKHIAFCLEENETEQNVNTKALAKLISWAWVSGISIVSLYDPNCRVHENSTELEIYLEKAIVKLRTQDYLPKVDIIFHNITKNSVELLGVESLDTKSKLHIIIFSSNDGKQGLVNTTKTLVVKNEEEVLPEDNNFNTIDICQDERYRKEEITEVNINNTLSMSLEPHLLVVFGSTSSTLGFLPWHIRLTEIHWLPTFPSFNMDDFSTLLHGYNICDQKLGK